MINHFIPGRLIILQTAALLLTACHTVMTPEQAAETENMLRAVTDRHYTLQAKTSHSMEFGMRVLTDVFYLKVEGDTLVSYLPFFGRAYNIPPGGGKALNFTALISDYTQQREKKDMTLITFVTDNGEDRYRFRIDLYDGGEATIDVLPTERERIWFDAEYITP